MNVRLCMRLYLGREKMYEAPYHGLFGSGINCSTKVLGCVVGGWKMRQRWSSFPVSASIGISTNDICSLAE